MKKYQMHIYVLALILLLLFIGKTGDELLFWLMDYFDLSRTPHIEVYVLVLSAIMLVGGCLLVLSVRNRKTNKDIFLRILMGSVIGGLGSVWLSEIFFRQWMERCCS